MVEPDASDPWEFYAQARTEHPVVYHPGLNAWLITRYDTILAVTADPSTFASQGSLPAQCSACRGSLVSPDLLWLEASAFRSGRESEPE